MIMKLLTFQKKYKAIAKELEITDVNNEYLKRGKLKVET